MLVIARSTLKKYVETRKGRPEYLALKASVDAWYLEADKASWAKMADVKAQFGKSSPSTANKSCSTSRATTTDLSSLYVSTFKLFISSGSAHTRNTITLMRQR